MDPWWFAFSAVVAILLNNSLAFVVGTLIWRWNVERTTTMRLSQAFTSRDQMNKQALYDIISDDPETMKLIDAAFIKGEHDWRQHLVATFGVEEADRVLSKLGSNI